MASRAQMPDNHAVKIDRIISRSLATIRDNPLVVLGISFIFAGVPQSILNYLSRGARTGIGQVNNPGQLGGSLTTAGSLTILGLSAVAMILFYMLSQAAMVRATIAQSEGRRATFGECMASGLRALLPLTGLNILFGLAVGFASLLLLVPGMLLYTMWAVCNAALVAERIGVFAAFSRSSDLTRGARWKVFGLELIAIVFIWVISSALGLVLVAVGGLSSYMAMARTGPPIWYLLASIVAQTLIAAIWSTIQASLYIELRNWKDGPGGGDLADVFA